MIALNFIWFYTFTFTFWCDFTFFYISWNNTNFRWFWTPTSYHLGRMKYKLMPKTKFIVNTLTRIHCNYSNVRILYSFLFKKSTYICSATFDKGSQASKRAILTPGECQSGRFGDPFELSYLLEEFDFRNFLCKLVKSGQASFCQDWDWL